MASVYSDIWHGDSAELVKKFKPGSITSVVTDPPFGVDNLSRSSVTDAGKKYARKIANDKSPQIAIDMFENVVTDLMPAMKDESDFYIFTSPQVIDEWLASTKRLFEKFKFRRKGILIWQKDGPGMGDLTSWGVGYEFILYYKRGRWEPHHPRVGSVLRFDRVPSSRIIHPHEKPVPLLEMLIKHSTVPGDWLVDPFAGSGSLMRASRGLDRNSIGIEYDERNYREAKRKLDGIGGGFDFD